MIVEGIPVGAIQANCYVLGDEQTRRGIVVDPGAEAERILAAVQRLDLGIERIVLTHGHFDHIYAVDEVRAATGAPMVAHGAEVPLLEGMQERMRTLWGMEVPPAPRPDALLRDGDAIAVGGYRLVVRHAPGHSEGHVVLLGDGIAVVGDVLFAGSIGRTDLPGGDFKTLMTSIARVLLPLPDYTVVYPGHGPATTIGRERATNPFLRPPYLA